MKSASIGGNIATNAGGLCLREVRVTTDYVLALTVVLADGNCHQAWRAAREGRRRSIPDQVVRRERGDARIIAEADRAAPSCATSAGTLVASFPTLEGSMETVLAITRRMRPSIARFMDRASFNAVEDGTAHGGFIGERGDGREGVFFASVIFPAGGGDGKKKKGPGGLFPRGGLGPRGEKGFFSQNFLGGIFFLGTPKFFFFFLGEGGPPNGGGGWGRWDKRVLGF